MKAHRYRYASAVPRVRISLILLAFGLNLALAGCATSSATHKPTSKDYRAYSDELLQSYAEAAGSAGTKHPNLADYWSENKEVMTAAAKAECLTLASKSRSKAISQVELDVATSVDNGSSRLLALQYQVASVNAARDAVCPQYDERASQILAYLTTQVAVEE